MRRPAVWKTDARSRRPPYETSYERQIREFKQWTRFRRGARIALVAIGVVAWVAFCYWLAV